MSLRPGVAGLPAALNLDRCLVMGVVNVTPDSFSDGGLFETVDTALERAHELANAGADLVDIGGESTRPGAQRVSEAEEIARVVDVVRDLALASVVVSIDTMRATVAAAALDAGAVMVNDVSGGLSDPHMLPLLAEAGVPCILMHWRGHSADMMNLTSYPGGVLPDVTRELQGRLDAAAAAGIDIERVALDPGIGFAKTPADNWPLLAGLDQLAALGRPLVVGASRKRFLGELAASDGLTRPPAERDGLTAAVSTIVAAAGAWAVRVHDVAPNRDAVAVARAIMRAREELT